MWTRLPYILAEKFVKTFRPYLLGQIYKWSGPSSGEQLEIYLFIYPFHNHLGHFMPQNLESWQFCLNMLCGWQWAIPKKNWGFFSNWTRSVTFKVGGATWGLFGGFPFFMDHATCALVFFHIHPVNYHLVLKEKTPPKLGIICGRYWLIHSSNTCNSHPKQAMPT